MPPTNRADQAVAGVLADTFAVLKLNVNLFHSKLREDVKGLQVACILDGGFTPDVCHQGTINPTMFKPSVQVIVRSDVGCSDAGLDLAKEMIEALHLSAPIAATATSDDPMFGFLDARVAESQPNTLEQTNDGQDQWSFNIDLEYEG